MSGGRKGAAIMGVVLLLLTATALAHGVLLVARAELSASRGYARSLEDASVLLARMDQALEAGIDVDLAGVPPWGVTELVDAASGGPGTLRLRRVGPESWWLERVGAGGVRRRVGTPGLLLWRLDPATRIRSLGAVVTVGPGAPVTLYGPIESAGFGRAEPPLDAATCEAEIGTALVGGRPDAVAVGAEGSSLGLGLLGFEELWSATPVELAGAGEPSAVWSGGSGCATDEPWNWGEPDRPAAPCGAHLAVRRAADTLHVAGGSGQAMLVVDGDLVLSGDARLHGFVVATGTVVLRDRSELHGMVLAEGGVSVAAGAVVRGSACWAALALREGARVWLPSPRRVPGLPPIAP